MTARLDLLAHGASSATRGARFPCDEALEASAIGALEALRGRLRPYAQVLTSPARAARETAAALGLDAEVETALGDCDYGRWRGFASKDVAEREPGGFALITPAKFLIAQKHDRRLSERSWIIGEHYICPVVHVQALRSDGSGNDGLARCHGLVDLEARAAPDA